jgi:hypothetical protein
MANEITKAEFDAIKNTSTRHDTNVIGRSVYSFDVYSPANGHAYCVTDHKTHPATVKYFKGKR